MADPRHQNPLCSTTARVASLITAGTFPVEVKKILADIHRLVDQDPESKPKVSLDKCVAWLLDWVIAQWSHSKAGLRVTPEQHRTFVNQLNMDSIAGSILGSVLRKVLYGPVKEGFEDLDTEALADVKQHAPRLIMRGELEILFRQLDSVA